MLRKVDKERLPQNLKNLLPNDHAEFIVLGDSVFEMCQMSFRDIKAMEVAVKDLVNKFLASRAEIDSVEDVTNIFLDSGLMPEILRNLYDVSEGDLEKLTFPQLVHAVNTFMDINFFSLPPESVQKLQQIIGFFISTVTSYSAFAPNTKEAIPGEKEPPQKVQTETQTSPQTES